MKYLPTVMPKLVPKLEMLRVSLNFVNFIFQTYQFYYNVKNKCKK